ncbi:two-component regulator propeller domain-containing protein [Arcticibacter sp.]|uniref:hybrid sensor histidine kinase/response regulator transcription factor n=1 Tax=Arcticibacter sp. TaxID=1872630 RepID=UPI00388D0F07
MFARTVTLISILLFWGTVWAQPNKYQFSQLHISSGLSHNQINSIAQDSQGFMWFGTLSGLNRYDGYKFKVFKHIANDSTTINDDNILNIQSGPHDKLWVNTREGYVIYDPQMETFERKPQKYLDSKGIKGSLTDIRGNGKGLFYVITSTGLYKFDESNTKSALIAKTGLSPITSVAIASSGCVWTVDASGKVERYISGTHSKVYSKRITEPANYKIFIDRDDDVWIYSADKPKGVYLINYKDESIKHYSTVSYPSLNTNNIYSVSQDEKGIIWLGTDHGGINLLDKKRNSLSFLVNREADEKSVAQNSTPVIYRDDTGIMWVGTFKKGLSYYHESIIKFAHYRHRPEEVNSLPYDDVNRFVEDKHGNLWIGTNGGGLIYFDRRKNTFKRYKHRPGDNNTLSNNVVVSLWIDHDEKLWIGTYFGGLDCFDGKKFSNYRHSETDASSLSDDRVWEIMEDSQRNLWVGTLHGGLDLFDRKTKTFKHFRSGKQNSVRSDYINALLEDRAGNIWVGTDAGVDILQKKAGRFKHYSVSQQRSAGLSNTNVLSLIEDSRGLIWIGTQEGVNLYDPSNGRFHVLKVDNGLPDNTILTLLEDRSGHIWLGTTKGISELTLIKRDGDFDIRFKNYDDLDGLQGMEFNENAALRTSRGELIFGGANGFNLFNPQIIKENTKYPVVVFTDFQLFNASVRPGQLIERNTILDRSITLTHDIRLNYDQSFFSIEFAALNFANAAKNKYAYMLEGFNDRWFTTDSKDRKATFTNLDPGEYTFKVRAANENGLWSREGAYLKIKILPPFWKTTPAYILYVLATAGFLYYLRQRGIRKLKAQFALEQERKSAQQMHELDMVKIKFFTNVSHEFRTPLALILAPLDKLLKENREENAKIHLTHIQRNARRLLHLVNQLMDFRKMEVKELKLQPLEDDIIRFAYESFQSFTDLAEKKNIRYIFRSNLSSFVTNFDHDKLERIFFNLLSNAFKFTSEGGQISMAVNCEPVEDQNSNVEVKIEDTGIGIAADKQEKIFERFFQNDVPGSMVNQGSGIGLSITKEFVHLHNGNIYVESEPGKGSCFIVKLPLVATSVNSNEHFYIEPVIVPKLVSHLENHQEELKLNRKKPTILLIEDNDDFRFYLKDNLKQFYNVLESSNGRTGWNKALAMHPDLIVSDVSMPELNGLDLCAKLRGDNRTSHIPIILLTALMGEEQVLRGIETGANDYMTKPFNFEILLSKIKNLLIRQESMRKTYQKQVEVKPSEIDVQSADERFIQQALRIIEKNISNSDFSVEEFAKDMFMSRVALYKKLLQLTRQTPIEFIRSMRLKRAARLLEKSQLSVAEIAYEAGFNNPKTFAKYFRAEFGVLPSSYLKAHGVSSSSTEVEEAGK